MSGFGKFCGVVRFVTLGFALLNILFGVLYLSPEIVQQLSPESTAEEIQIGIGAFFGNGIFLLILSLIAFLIHGAQAKKYKVVLKYKAQLEPYFKEMMDTLCDGYSEQTNTAYKIVWKNPNKKGYKFQIIIHLYLDDKFINGDSVNTVMEDIQRYLDTRPTPLQEEVPFLYRVVLC